MRKLNADDLMDAMQLADIFDMQKVHQRMKTLNSKDAETVGRNALFILMKEASSKENRARIYEFLAKPLECTPEEVKSMELLELAKKINHIASVKEWIDFFKSAQV